MHGLKPDEGVSFFCNLELLQVCIGRNEVIFNFDGETAVTVTGGFKIGPTGSPNFYDDPIAAASALASLVGGVATSATPTASGGLLLKFNSGTNLIFLDDSSQYESFVIRHADKLVVV